jgi:hypothetical protein
MGQPTHDLSGLAEVIYSASDKKEEGKMERNLGGKPLVVAGAIDMHLHFGPEPLVANAAGRPHAVDPLQAALEAAELGMTAIVLKAHEFPSTLAAHMVAQTVDTVQVFGGICCDFPVGGLNPVAVEVALNGGAKVVWLPTLSSATYKDKWFQALGWSGRQGLRVIDNEGALLPEVYEIMDLVAEHGAVLATGHIDREEHFRVAEAFGSRGQLIVTHAMQESFGSNPILTEQDCVELAELGAFIEFTAHSCMGNPAVATRIASAAQRIPADRVVLSTDYGWNVSDPHPGPGLQSYLSSLYEMGAPESTLARMSSINPGRVLRISVSA